MSHIQIAKLYSILLGGLGLIGLIISGRFLGIINMDPFIDVMRLILAAWLTYAAFITRTEIAVRSALIVTGVAYILIAVLGMMSGTGGGVFPSGLTQFDILFHLAGGVFALWVGVKNENELPARS